MRVTISCRHCIAFRVMLVFYFFLFYLSIFLEHSSSFFAYSSSSCSFFFFLDVSNIVPHSGHWSRGQVCRTAQ